MIQKFVRLTKIGKFVDCRPRGDVQLRKLTLIYGENGRGKTTLCSVLRALADGDRLQVDERKTLGADGDCEAEILTDAGLIQLTPAGWSQPFPRIAVYDSAFVHENVYAGEHVDHDHKKNLHRIIVGNRGVELAKRIDELDQQSRNAAREVREKRGAVAQQAPAGYDPDAFMPLANRPNVDNEISAVEKEIQSLSQIAEIQAKALLSPAHATGLPAGFRELLGKTVADVATTAESTIREHVQQHTAAASEQWLHQGMQHKKGDACPFCGQSTEGNELIEAFGTYFSDSYAALKNEIARAAQEIDRSLGDHQLAITERAILSNDGLLQFWLQFVDVDSPAFNIDALQAATKRLRAAAEGLLETKKASPLESIADFGELDTAEEEFTTAAAGLPDYNQAVARANTVIERHKTDLGTANLARKQSDLLDLRAAKARHEPNAIQACTEYGRAQLAKQQIEIDKEQAKQDLDDYSRTIFSTYTGRLNELLENFNATFRIANLSSQYTGGHPSSTYHVLINNQAVSVGDRDTPRGTPCIRTTLSAGDRSTIALAFFIARLENDPDLADTVVVFDDPFTSQDRFRRTCTQQLICRKVDVARQVIVLSHDPLFLKLIWDHCDHDTTKTLVITRAGADNATIQDLDLAKETQGDYFQDHAALTAYLYHNVGDKRDVAKRIRTLLEGYLRVRFPAELPADRWLGDLIEAIRNADAASSLQAWQGPPLAELTDINDYSKKFHHDKNSAAATEPVDDGELQGYVRRTLRMIGGY
jgi:wobble nucleotide-excising tRNase